MSKRPFDDIYSKSLSDRRAEQKRKDAFAWKTGIFVITVISIVGIYALWWATNL